MPTGENACGILSVCIARRYRPSTPIGEVLQNRFLNNWLETMQNKQAASEKERADATVSISLRSISTIPMLRLECLQG